MISFDIRPPTIEWRGRPILRFMLLPGWEMPACGDCSYYGWRWWIGAGRLLVLVGRAKAD